MNAIGALLGAVAAAGLLLAVLGSPLVRRIRLADRLRPYVQEWVPPSSLLAQDGPGGAWPLGRLLSPAVAELAATLDRLVGGSSSVRRRLTALGRDDTLEQFRQDQVLWSATGAGIGILALAARLSIGHGPPPLSLVGLTFLGALGGFFLRDQLLNRAVRRREELIALELPVIAELLALAIGAGESPIAALERVTRRTGGELSREMRVVLADARSGVPFVQALGAVAQRTTLPALGRFVDGMSVALQRGTPLAEVLRAQAIDVRDASRRSLLEAGGRREIAMMAPVVFFVLPVVILFALFPGAVTLTSISH